MTGHAPEQAERWRRQVGGLQRENQRLRQQLRDLEAALARTPNNPQEN